MKRFRLITAVAIFLAPLLALAQDGPNAAPDSRESPPDPMIAQQEPPPPPGGMRPGGGPGPGTAGPMERGEFGPPGAWWKNSEIVSKLQLSEEQVRKISQTFTDHRLKLIDLQAELAKEELRLQPLLDVDQPDESKVGAQIDLITAARGRLEKENAMMMLDIRRCLSAEQWKKLKSLGGAPMGPPGRGNRMRGGPGNTGGLPPPPNDPQMQGPPRPQ
jgi:Spy/CpxP family protein refolding chaperone